MTNAFSYPISFEGKSNCRFKYARNLKQNLPGSFSLLFSQGQTNSGYQALLDAARDGFLSPDEIRRFAPDTPSPNDVECYVDVETVS